MAPQRIRILLARRLQADAPDADQRLGAVGDQQRFADEVDRLVAVAAPVHVLAADRGGDLGGLAVVRGVVAAHDPLQLGELADHVGEQVGLGEQRGAVGERGRCADARRDPRRDAPHALHALRPGCRACRDRRPCRAPARAIRACASRSWSKKNFASARRGRTTRSLPSTMRDGSAGEMLLTTRKRLVSLPAASSSGKYFWLAFIVRTRHSGGTSRNSRSNWQVSTFGRSTSAVTSSSSASSSMGASCAAAAAACSWRRISSRRSSKPAITAPSSRSWVAYVSAERNAIWRQLRLEAMALRRPAGVEAERADGHDVARHAARRGRARAARSSRSSSRRRAGTASPSGSAAARARCRGRAAGRRRASRRRRRRRGTASRSCRRRGAAVAARAPASAPSAASFLSSAGVASPAGDEADARPASACARPSDRRARAATASISTASRRGVAYDVTVAPSRSRPSARRPAAMPSANAAPSLGKAFGGSSSTKQLDEQRPMRVARHHAACRASSALFFAASWATTSSAHAFGAIGKPSRARLSR